LVALIIRKTSIRPRRKKRVGQAWKRHKTYTKKGEMPPVTFVGSLCKIRAILCSKIADIHGIEVHDVRT